MLPTETLTSMLDEPSSGSNTSRYLPRGYDCGIWYGPAISSEAMPARCPDHSAVAMNI